LNYRTAKIVAKIIEKMEKYENYLDFLNNMNYTDEFEVHYRDKVFVLENEVLRRVLIDYYINKAKDLHKKLDKI
jgi:hypothetical protein